MPQFSDRELEMLRGNQMPRGTGFAEQGGYQGQVYNTPPMQQPMGQISDLDARMMARPMPMPMGQITQQDAQMMARPQPMPRMQPLSPEQIQEFRQLLHQQRLQEIFNQNRMQGMLGQQ